MRTNFAPTARTIVVSLGLILIGLLATYGPLATDQVGVLAFVAAIGLLLVGMVVRRL